MKLPLGRAGAQVRLSFRAGDGPLTLYQATIAFAGTGGVLASTPVLVTFGGQAGFAATSRQRVTSDSINFPVHFNDEVSVSFDVDGALSQSAMMGFPDSYVWAGSYATSVSPPVGTEYPQATGLDTIDVLGTPGRAFVTLGDSITEGYVEGDVGTFNGHSDDYRNAWTTVAQRATGIPFANAAVSGQGLEAGISHLGAEVFTLGNVTDCAVLLGTNDLASLSDSQIEGLLTTLIGDLSPFCRVWIATLLPKQSTTMDMTAINAERQRVNAWIREQTAATPVLLMDSAVDATGDSNSWQAGLTSDGIHPSIQGDAVLGEYVATSPIFAVNNPDAGERDAGEPPSLQVWSPTASGMLSLASFAVRDAGQLPHGTVGTPGDQPRSGSAALSCSAASDSGAASLGWLCTLVAGLLYRRRRNR